MTKKQFLDYIKDYSVSEDVKKIIEATHHLNTKGFDNWGFKKLIFLEYYLHPYLLKLSKKTDCYYLDLFSGSGANKVGNKDYYSIGSAILSLLKGYKKFKNGNIFRFHKWIFFEEDKENFDALSLRVKETIKLLNEKYGASLEMNKDIKLLNENSNDFILDCMEEIKRDSEGKHCSILVFIDPYKFSEIKWETIEKILRLKYVDIIFTIPTSTLNRSLKVCSNLKEFLSPTLLKNYSENCMPNLFDESISKVYAKDIVNSISRSIWFLSDNAISVKNRANSELYKIELFSHNKNAVLIAEDCARRLRSIDCKTVDSLINQIKGNQSSLGDFLF